MGGTSIQFAEEQILLLEREHEARMKKTVDELIADGFLDSDYEGSSGNFSSDDEESDFEFFDDEAYSFDCEYVFYEDLAGVDCTADIIDNYTYSSDDDGDFEECTVYELVNEPEYEMCIYERVIFEIDYEFYECMQ